MNAGRKQTTTATSRRGKSEMRKRDEAVCCGVEGTERTQREEDEF